MDLLQTISPFGLREAEQTKLEGGRASAQRELAAEVENSSSGRDFGRRAPRHTKCEGKGRRTGRSESATCVGLADLYLWSGATAGRAYGEPGNRSQEAYERDHAGSGADRQRDPSLVGRLCDSEPIRLRLVSASTGHSVARGRTSANAMAGYRSEVALLDDSWRIRQERPRPPGGGICHPDMGGLVQSPTAARADWLHPTGGVRGTLL